MRLMAIGECRPGDKAADVIRGRQGKPVLYAGDVMTEDKLEQLRGEGLDVLPVEWTGWEGVAPDWWLPESLIGPLETWSRRGLEALDGEGLTEARRLVRQLMERFPRTERRPFEWIPLYRGGNPASVSWMNTIGLTIKLSLAMEPKWAEDFGLAAFLLGMEMAINEGTVTLPSDERLGQLAARVKPLSAIPATARAAIAQHHARWDGSGTPALKGDQIYGGARILGLAELINALLYRTDEPALPINEALEWVVGGAGLDFPLELIQALQRTVAPYPVGTAVQLGNGEVGVVLDNPPDWPGRPLIRMVNGPDRGYPVALKAPDQHVRVITGFYHRRELPSS